MSDLQRLSLAKSRLNNLRKNKSLFDLTEKKIVKGFETFISDEREDDMKRIQRLPTLPACMRQKLLDGLCELTSTTIGEDKQMQELKRILSIFTHLLCPQIKEIALNGMLTFSPKKYRETALSQILILIATHAPNVLSLTLNVKKSCVKFEFWRRRARVQAIARLNKLRKLKLDTHQVKYAEAKEICKQLPKLKYFDVRLDMSDKSIVQDNIEGFKEAFPQLKVFLFPAEWWCETTRYLFKQCLQHLPQLQVVQGCVCSSLYAPTLASPDNFGDSLQPSALCYLKVDWLKLTRPWHLKFPNIRHLQLEGNYGVSMEYIKPVLQFKKIESLKLNDFGGKEVVETLLKTYGHNLHTLKLAFRSFPLKINLKTIFANCPKLRTIILDHVNISDSSAPIKFFPPLKQFTWVTSDSAKNAFLSNILQAPALETISIYNENYDVEDLKAVSALIAEKKILRKLRNFRYTSSLIEMENVNLEFFRAMSDVIKNASAFLPKLSSVKLALYYKNNDLISTKEKLVQLGSGGYSEMSLQKELCLICALPTADGAILVVHVDKEKLETWILNVCGHELAEEIEDHDLICYFCLWHAEFQWKFDEMVDESLVWWPRNSENLDDAAKELRKNYFEGKLEQCWVQLKKTELPKSADGEEEQIVEVEIRPRRWNCICCEKTFKYSYQLSGHVKKTHKEAIRSAHCVDQKGSTLEAGSLVVALGKELLNSGWTKDDGVSIHSVRSVIKHEEYDHNLVKNDIALLQLTRSVETTITVSPLCLWYKSSNFELLNNVNGTIAGWGLIQDYNLADQLQRLDLPILNPDQCKLIEGKETFYSTKMRASPKFCAGYINRNKSPCNGDSGAALVVEENGVFYARGIVSETVAKNIDNGKFCNTDYPAIFTDVAAYRRWIIDHTDDELKYSYVP
ncbi:Hypothetical predicted protein [Cloeon dipterum]|uniref:C2H2-type domain-containing protein n=1 Tax=Cloeon dipterum TaxID=197152 RepID=A0A8S1E2A8_9INSE|nr:Hypothetical predicted protein [Cloeon dipterum]